MASELPTRHVLGWWRATGSCLLIWRVWEGPLGPLPPHHVQEVPPLHAPAAVQLAGHVGAHPAGVLVMVVDVLQHG
jgi:hypothetical protein